MLDFSSTNVSVDRFAHEELYDSLPLSKPSFLRCTIGIVRVRVYGFGFTF